MPEPENAGYVARAACENCGWESEVEVVSAALAGSWLVEQANAALEAAVCGPLPCNSPHLHAAILAALGPENDGA